MANWVHFCFWAYRSRQQTGSYNWLLLLLFSVTALPTQAQTCSGPNAEVLINETFGTVTSRTSLAQRTSYRATTASCPNDGEYALASRVDGTCFGGAWHAVPTDHTQAGEGGTMLIVNGSNIPGEFYRQVLPSLCGNSTYEFSVWGLNLLKLKRCSRTLVPDLSIQIETASGRLLAKAAVGSIPETAVPTWQRFSVSFTTPHVDEAVVVKLIDNQGQSGCGNDFLIDDLQLIRCNACPAKPVYVPDVFTPNNDQKNDRLAIYLTGATSVTINVFDRWGNAIFSSTNLEQQWDGTVNGQPCPEGQYIWTVSYQFVTSLNTTSTYSCTGRVLLMR